MTLHSEICIYVVCLAAQRQGQHHGIWIDVLKGEEHIESEIKNMLSKSPAPQPNGWVIQDSKGLGELALDEVQDLSVIALYARFIDQYGVDLVSEVQGFTRSLPDAVNMMEYNYYGEHASTTQFVEDYIKELYDIPDDLAHYIDFEEMADDWFSYHYVAIEVSDSVHVFSN
jgi:antirestriction protein